jgi:curved DNA-binding protein CbpA
MDGRRARRVLGVASDAGPDEIRRAFRARALVTHPDQGGTPELFAETQAAFAVLKDAPPRRRMFSPVPRTSPRVDVRTQRSQGWRSEGAIVDVYDSPRRPSPRRDFGDVLRAATARVS